MAQCVVHHHRTEVGAADTDVDDGLDALAGGALPLTGAQLVGEVTHRVEHCVHVGDHVLAVDGQRRIARQPQRGVQHRTVLGGVDVLTGEHPIASGLKTGRLGQRDEQFYGLGGDAVLAVVDVEVTDGQRHIATAIGVFVEELPQVFGADLVVMAGQCIPGGGSGNVRFSGHSTDPSAAMESKV